MDGSLWVVDADDLYRVQDSGDKGPSGATQQFVDRPRRDADPLQALAGRPARGRGEQAERDE